MKRKNGFGIIVKSVYNKIQSKEYKEEYKMQKKDFTRNRKMDFAQTVVFILSGTKKSLQSALYSFFKEMKQQEETYTKQAFSKGRQRINPNAFLDLFRTVTDEYYDIDETKKYRGYRVLAIDGTRYNLPNTEELAEKYGIQNMSRQVQSLGSCLYDVLNGMLIDVHMMPLKTNERDVAEAHIEALNTIKTDKELILMDRGYPSAKLLKKIDDSGYKFAVRCEPNFIKAMNITGDDEVVEHKFNNGIVSKLRIVRFNLENQKEEIIVTNIFDESYSAEDFKYIYHLRWGIEEKYNDLKNKLQIENFSGTNEIAILQDFYATMFLNNMAAILMSDYADEIEERYNTKELKHKYKMNVSMTISLLKLNLIEMLTTDSDRKREKIFKQICTKLINCVVPIRDDRSYPRKRKYTSLKFPNNTKSL